MRIALVSPYSWTYPGGVTRHIEALRQEFASLGHDVRVLAPVDPPDKWSARRHRGAVPQERELPDWLVPLGRTMGFPANGAVSNLTMPYAPNVSALRRELREGGYDVVHLHEPVVPCVGWDTLMSCGVPMVGTFHCYSTNQVSNGIAVGIGARRRLNRLKVRIAVSEAAAWTGERFFGGRYRIIPNGVAVDESLTVDPAVASEAVCAERPLRIAFVGQAVERKGLPVLLRAFEALREHVPAELKIVGATPEEVQPLLLDGDSGVTVLGKVDDEAKVTVLREADVLAAPSLGGESFGMVLTEGFAAGTPVVASDIAGYRDVVTDGVDGVLVPRGDAAALGEALRALALDGARRASLAAAALESAKRYAWPVVAAEVLKAYEDAIAIGEPAGSPVQRAAVRIGALPADLQPRRPARRLPTMEPPAPRARARRPVIALARKAMMALIALAILAGSFVALQRIGIDRIGHSLVHATPWWVMVALGLMCASMAVRAVSWTAILRAAIPTAPRPRLSDALQGTMIGVLMSATLPARLGEPARAMIVARRIGRPRDGVPLVLGTIVSQTLLNILALVILGMIMFRSVPVFHHHESGLIAFAALPLVILGAVLGTPALLRERVWSPQSARVRAWFRQARRATAELRAGLEVFRHPKLGAVAVSAQLLAWVIQWMSCWVLLMAFGIDDRAGVGAAAAVLFAVNVSAVLPATPSNLGVFQAACVFVLHKGYGISVEDALGYGIILQAVEIATAFVMGAPALLKEGVSWKDVRLRAMHAAPVELPPLPRRGEAAVEVDA
jgi:phosphatidyl-myo-inositol alpha-mannosyltransferase